MQDKLDPKRELGGKLQKPDNARVHGLSAFSVTVNLPGWEAAEFVVAAKDKDKAKAFAFSYLRDDVPNLKYTDLRTKRAPEFDGFAFGLTAPAKLGGRDSELNTFWGCCATKQPPLELV